MEALLFSSGKGIKVEEIAQITQLPKTRVLELIEELSHEYKARHSSIIILPEGDMFKMSVAEKFLSVAHHVNPHTELSRQVLETLAYVAWKQPVLQSEVIHMRTTAAYEHIAELVDKGFVTRDSQGRSFLLKLTPKFYEYFDLPTQAQVREVFKDVSGKGDSQSQVAEFDAEPQLGRLQVYETQEEQTQKEEPELQTYTQSETVPSQPAVQNQPQAKSLPNTPLPQNKDIDPLREELKKYEVPKNEPFQVQKPELKANVDVQQQGTVTMNFTGPIIQQDSKRHPENISTQGSIETSQKRTKDLIGDDEVADVVEEEESIQEHEEVSRRVQEILEEKDDEFEFEGDPDRVHIGPYPVEQAKFEIEGVAMNKRESRLLDELTKGKGLSFMTERKEDDDEEQNAHEMDEESEVEQKTKQIESGHAEFKEK